MDIKNNIDNFTREITAAGARLIAVSKTHPAETVLAAYHAGQQVFGENKVQEMVAKQGVLPTDIRWHMIGHLQTNKVKMIAAFVDLIHSVDSLKLLSEIDKQGRKINRVIPCLLQIYIAREETKFGFDENEVITLFEQLQTSPFSFVKIEGLMGMASLTNDDSLIQKEFRQLKKFFDLLASQNLPTGVQMNELSMGMSSDYQIALREGSTLVRIGTAIFGSRTVTTPA